MLRAIDGKVVTAKTQFLEDGAPVIAQPGYPKLALLDADKTVIAQYPVTPTVNSGEWEAHINLPDMGLTKTEELKLRWRLRADNGDKYQTFDTLIVDPKVDRRDSEIVVMEGDSIFEFALPYAYLDETATRTSVQLFYQNSPATAQYVLTSANVDVGVEKTLVTMPAPAIPPNLQASLLQAKVALRGRPRTFNYRYWCITPQMSVASVMLEEFLNKVRIQNVIPELDYTAGDLLSYLERGLYLFNMAGGITTSYTGTNMQGIILDCWVTCATYYAISTQLIAEGSLTFDFSGQGISLNVDRTPQLDAALGRVEARIQDMVIPFKKQSTSQGFFGGDGSQGDTAMRNPYSSGVVSLTNAPTTRINGWGLGFGRRY